MAMVKASADTSPLRASSKPKKIKEKDTDSSPEQLYPFEFLFCIFDGLINGP